MSLVVAILGLTVALLVPSVRVLLERRRPGDVLLREHLLERYVVTIASGETFSGLLAQVDDRTVVLRDVKVLSANDSPVDGELILRRESIAYLQRP